MLRMMWNKILSIFDKSKTNDNEKIEENEQYAVEYGKTKDINFTAIFANKLANYVVSDANIDIEGNNQRCILLQDILKRLKKKLKKVISKELGVG